MMKKINEIAIDEKFETFVLIKEMKLRTSKNGKEYQQFKFRDKSGEMIGFLWDVNPYTKSNFVAGTVVFLKGKKELYQNMTQFNQLSMQLPKKGEPSNPEDFEQTPQKSKEELQELVSAYVEKIQHESWKQVVEKLLEKYEESFFTYPAAKSNHHDFPTGLAFHTSTMLEVAESLGRVYPQLNLSLLYAGVILHDLAKVIELSGGIQTEYTTRGNLLGHIALIDEEVMKVSCELSLDDTSEEMVVLRHVLLAHHGELAFGSPVRPKILEAEMLHLIDKMDASVMMITNSLALVSPGETTTRVSGLDGRNFYKPLFRGE